MIHLIKINKMMLHASEAKRSKLQERWFVFRGKVEFGDLKVYVLRLVHPSRQCFQVLMRPLIPH
jgi:hypothetical protein